MIEASPHDADVIWAGANDGPVHVTHDGGTSWDDVTPPDMPAEGRINSIDISRHDPDRVYVAGYRFLLGDFRPYAYRTDDAGETWTRLTDGTNGIPADVPVRVLREDPDREGLLYAGTEFGLFISFDDGATWQSFQLDLPVTPVTDIEVVRQDLALSTMGRGFWVLDDLTPLHEIDADGMVEAAGPAHVFAGRPQYRTRPGRNSGFEWASNTARPQYPGAGADISYWISPDLGPDATVRVEILDDGGEVVRTYESGAGAGAGRAGGPAMQRMAPRGGGRATVATTPGVHRLRWDMRARGEGRSGPIMPPGDYTVRLTAGGATTETGLELRIDPRVAAEGVTIADLEAQYRFNLAVRETQAEAREVARGIADLREQLEEARAGAGGGGNRTLDEVAADLDALDARVNDAEGSYPRPHAPQPAQLSRRHDLPRRSGAGRGCLHAPRRTPGGGARRRGGIAGARPSPERDILRREER